MNPDQKEDPRLKSSTPMPRVSQNEAAKNRDGRMLNIIGSLTQWLQDGDGEHIQSVKNVTADIYSLKLHENNELPVVYLFDPLGVARELAAKYQLAWEKMKGLLEDLANPDHQGEMALKFPFAKRFDSAVLANRYFFGKMPDIEPEGLRSPTCKDKEQWVRARVQREKWKKHK